MKTKPAKPNGWEEIIDKHWRTEWGWRHTSSVGVMLDELQSLLDQQEQRHQREVEITKTDDCLDNWYQCPKCLEEGFDSYIRDDFIYCPWCGVKVKWLDQISQSINKIKKQQ